MTTLTETQRKHYDALTRARDEVAYCYCYAQHALLGEQSSNAARQLATARAHFTTALTQLIESIRDEHRNSSATP